MNKKTKFFKNVLLLQFVPVFLLGVFILSNPKSQKVIRIREIHPYEFNYGYAIPLFVFGIGLVLALFSLFSKREDSPQDEAGILKIKRQQNFWRFAFYGNLLFVAAVGAFSMVIFYNNPLTIDQSVLFYTLIFSRSLLIIILSLVVASFFLTTGIYWKSNKTMAVSLLIISFFMIGGVFASDLKYVRLFSYNSENYSRNKNEKRSSDTVVKPGSNVETIAQDDSVKFELIEPEVEKSRLSFSWNSLIPDWGGLKEERSFSDLRFLIKKSLNDRVEEDKYYYIFEYVDMARTHPFQLYESFKNYKSIFYNAVSLESYRVANFDKIVDGLLLTYNDIGTDEEKLYQIYELMGSYNREHFTELEKYCSSETMSKLREYKFSNGKKYDKNDLMWFYSFWARRNNEGNIKEVAIILNEIKEHYDKLVSE